MQKIIEYNVSYSENLGLLIEEVNSLFVAGWQPLGGVMRSAETEYSEECWAQAMVKYEQ